MADYGFLDPAEEDALHATRLLNVEEKLYKRLTRGLLSPTSFIYAPLVAAPLSPPPEDGDTANNDANDTATNTKVNVADQLDQQRQWRTDALLDFAAFEGNIVRIQLLLNSNERERQRYAEEKTRILVTAQEVREDNARLHDQLKEAQRVLEIRKGYDALADEITKRATLKPRDDQQANIEKLKDEIAELEREKGEYASTWAERREQFGRIVEEGMQMLRLIRDEKEEAERQEGLEDGEGSDEETSRSGTPRPSMGGATPVHVPEEPNASGETNPALHPLSQVIDNGDAQDEDTQKSGNEDAAIVNGDIDRDEGPADVDDTQQEEVVDSMDTS